DVLWRGPEAAGGADATIETPHTGAPHAQVCLAEQGGRWPCDVRNPRGRSRPRCVEGVGLSCQSTSIQGLGVRGGVPVKHRPTWHTTLALVCGLPGPPCPQPAESCQLPGLCGESAHGL